MGNAWSAPDAVTLAQVAAELAGHAFSALPMCDILENLMKALSDNLASYRGDGGAHDPQAAEAEQLEQRAMSIRELIAHFPKASVDKEAREWQALYHTLDKIVRVLKDLRRKGKVRRALGSKDIC